MDAVHTENKMGVMSEGKLLFQMSLPMIISMLVLALYNVVDSIFVSQINENALTAVSLAFPIQNLMISIATGTAVGVNALASRSLGEKHPEQASHIARHGIFLAIISAIGFALIMLVATKPFMAVQSSNEEIYEYGVTYLSIVCTVCIGLFLQTMFERLLTATGRTYFSMISQASGAVINIIFDPIFIFGYGPFPEMGVAGAAIATVMGQIIGAALALFFNIAFNRDLSINMLKFRPKKHTILTIYKIGVPSIIMASVGSVMTFGMNLILINRLESSTAAAVFGIYFKLNSLICMPIFGLNNGMVPIIAYNYGAQKKHRITRTAKLAVVTATCLMILGILLFWLIPDKLLLLFNASENMLSIGVHALRIISISFIFAGYCIVIGSVMQALGDAIYSMINSLARQLFVLLPAAYILACIGGLDLIWWSYPIAEISSLILTTVFFVRVYRRKIRTLPDLA